MTRNAINHPITRADCISSAAGDGLVRQPQLRRDMSPAHRKAPVGSTPSTPIKKGRSVAKKTVFVSDLSGKEITEGKGAVISIRFNDARKGAYVLDVTDEEA